MKVLIVKASALGDIVHALPVLPYLKSVDPRMIIDWVVEEPFAPLLDDHPLVRNVYRIDTRLWRQHRFLPKEFHRMADIVSRLHGERYNAVLDLQGNIKSGVFTLLSRAPLRYGFDSESVREWPNLFATNRRVPLTEDDHHITDRSLKIASTAFQGGTKKLKAPLLTADGKRQAEVKARLNEEGVVNGRATQRIVLLHPGTTWRTKRWPVDSWKLLASALVKERQIRLVLSWGNEEERSAAAEICESVKERAILWPRGNLRDLLALLFGVDLVVGGDTGPVHIAAALGTPTVSLFRATDARRNGPRGRDHVRLQSPLPCSPCLLKNCSQDEACGRSIAVESVLEAILSRLESVTLP